MHLHRSDGTELLTAEAADAACAVDLRLPVFHNDGLSRADFGAFSAADASAMNGRTGAERPFCDKGEDASEKPSVSGKGKTAANRNMLKFFDFRKGGFGKNFN